MVDVTSYWHVAHAAQAPRAALRPYGLEQAQAFRDRFRPHGVVHRCTIEEGVPVRRDPGLVAVGVDLAGMVDDALRAIERRARRYWTSEPTTETAEILVMGTVVVAEVVPPGS